MLEIKRSKNFQGCNTFDIITDDGSFQIYENGFDLYWDYNSQDDENKEIKTFKITKENYHLYEALDNLYTSIECSKPYYNYPYAFGERDEMIPYYGRTELYNGNEIRWYSDDFAFLDDASSIAIRKREDYFIILFTKSKREEISGFYNPTFAVKFKSFGSRYMPYDKPFMYMYQRLQQYNPDYHQIDIEEYLYEEECKKRVKTK